MRESIWASQVGSDLTGLAEHVDGLGQLLGHDEDVVEFVGLVRRAGSIAGS